MRMMRLREERGVAAVVVAVSLVGVFSALVLSLDEGNLWDMRRRIVTATDAAALREAQIAAESGTGTACSTGWQQTIYDNAGTDAVAVSCTVSVEPGGAGAGYVVVEARKPSAVMFGRVIGISGDTSAYSKSAARWGYILSMQGMRPFALCMLTPAVQNWLTDGTIADPNQPSPGVHRITFGGATPCGSAAGNWGIITLPTDASNSNDQTRDLFLHGYDGSVAINDCNADGSTGDGCPGNPGAIGETVEGAFTSLIANGHPFPILLFTSVTGSGGNASYNAAAFLGVILKGFKVSNIGSNARYFDLQFVNLTRSGKCCSNVGADTGIYSVRLCSIDGDDGGTLSDAGSPCRSST